MGFFQNSLLTFACYLGKFKFKSLMKSTRRSKNALLLALCFKQHLLIQDDLQHKSNETIQWCATNEVSIQEETNVFLTKHDIDLTNM